jgi:hypothetical protein
MDLPMPARDWAPVESCTLPTSERPLRVAEFDDLFAASLRAVEHPGDDAVHARLVLAGDETLAARVQRLTDAESSCCSFFAFAVTPLEPDPTMGATRLALDIRVPSAHADVLAALVERARAATS